MIAVLAAVMICFCSYGGKRSAAVPMNIPDTIFVGGQQMHVQGLAIDKEKGYMYFSFTSRFIKTDLQGNILGSIDRIQGHLGAMTFNPADRKVYASLECKDDEIGAGIAGKLGTQKLDRNSIVFYIAIIDVDKVDRLGIDPENDDVLKTVCIKEAVEDYKAKVQSGNSTLEHKYGCSGIDGVTIAPQIGHKGGKKYLYVAYGIYSDLYREDNDYQVILCYDIKELARMSRMVTFGEAHSSGPARPAEKYFIYTGNTNWGVQNLSYDEYTGNIFMAVYKGKKPTWPNYNLYAFPVDQKPFNAPLKGVDYDTSIHTQLRLAPEGLIDKTGVRGWRFKYGSTGMCPLGDGRWIISRNGKDKVTREEFCNATLYRWTGDSDKPFER